MSMSWFEGAKVWNSVWKAWEYVGRHVGKLLLLRALFSSSFFGGGGQELTLRLAITWSPDPSEALGLLS